eukprot:TRINITY_DN1492_c0_g2_i2.p1 TRINITY_DN1492_c0_g2~~TRINITY_DN1492_c0_g2_i2.p1  ORF type:complete len:303 (+),score=66.05 TRINITY_DN1492_c0_g2_i2:71-979(+)
MQAAPEQEMTLDEVIRSEKQSQSSSTNGGRPSSRGGRRPGPSSGSSRPRRDGPQRPFAPSDSRPRRDGPNAHSPHHTGSSDSAERFHPYRKDRSPNAPHDPRSDRRDRSSSSSQKGLDFDLQYQSYRVVRETVPERIAALLSSSARRGQCPSFMAVGPVCNAIMIRGIIMTRDYLSQDQIELLVQTEFVVITSQLSAIKYSITKSSRRRAEHHIDVVLKAAHSTDVKPLAGAVATNIRLGKRVAISAIGADSLNQAVKAFTVSRGYVEPNNLDLTFITDIQSAENSETEATPTRLIVFAQQI